MTGKIKRELIMGRIEEEIHKYDNPQPTFLEALNELQKKAKNTNEIPLRTIFSMLSGKGYAALFILLSLPFTFPIQIPGVSTPFGIIMAFLSLRFAFAKRLWWPEWILNKTISSQTVETISEKTITILQQLKKITRPRMTFLAQNTLLHLLHGLTIFVLSLLLMLPLPIPFTNLLTALPIFSFGIGLLEDDGVFILLAYLLSLLCLVYFFVIVILGKSAVAVLGEM